MAAPECNQSNTIAASRWALSPFALTSPKVAETEHSLKVCETIVAKNASAGNNKGLNRAALIRVGEAVHKDIEESG